MSRIAGFSWAAAIGMMALAVASVPAAAFKEQQVQPAAPSSGGSQMAPLPEQPKVQLQIPDLSPGKDKGTEVRIPGLGKVGVLPKLDFGLDILYGAQDDKRREELPAGPGRSDDMKIEGRIKHKF